MVWKTDDNAILQAQESNIWIQEILEDGYTFVDGTEPVKLMSAERVKDQLIVEGPSLLYKDGFYYLFFSAGGFNTPKYHVNVARSEKVCN